MRQSSGSHNSCANPLATRAKFVFSNARRSIVVAWSNLGEAEPPFTVAAEPSGNLTLRGREYLESLTGSPIRRATGRGSAFCAGEVEQKASKASNTKPENVVQVLIWEKEGGCICRVIALGLLSANKERC